MRTSIQPLVRRTLHLIGLLVVLLSAGCGAPQSATPKIMGTDTPIAPTTTERPSSTPMPTATPIPPTPTPTLTPTPAPLSPSAIFDRVAPSVAYVETPLGSGSAILIEGDFLLTNAHVVWPYDEVRAVFPDGSEFKTVPLVGWDKMVDLAILGPLAEVAAPPLGLADGEASAIGSDVYLVGYPGEVDAFPQPTITRGLISRKREWEAEEITYFQTDATISGGQSGGALISEKGEVIGISGFAFAAADFGLVASAADVSDRIARLIAGEDTSGLGADIVDHTAVDTNFTVRLRHAHDAAAFLVAEDCGPRLEVEAESEVDIVLQFVDPWRDDVKEIDEGIYGVERLAVSVERNRPYFIVVFPYGQTSGTVTLGSSCGLITLEDDDDRTILHADERVVGSVDFPGDLDLYYFDMGEGELVNFLVDSASINPFIYITYPGARFDGWVEDDDSGGGLFGLNADLTFRAPHRGTFFVTVGDASGVEVGGYSLAVYHRRSGAPTPVSLPPTPTPISSDLGPMQLHASNRSPFAMQIPASLQDITSYEANCFGTCFASEDGYLVIVEEDAEASMGEAGRAMTRDQYVSRILRDTATFFPNLTLQSWQTVTSQGGVAIDVAHYRFSADDGVFHVRLLVAFEDGIGFSAFYLVPDESYGELEPIIDYSFSTLTLDH